MKLSDYIKKAGLTQSAFAAKIPCTEEYLSRVMNGKQKPGDIFVAALFGLTGGDVDGIGDILKATK